MLTQYDPSTPLWRLFWAKTDRSGERPQWTRPLWAHLIDVANTAWLLWDRYLPEQLRRAIMEATGLSRDEAGRWFALQIGLHDLGKAIPCFQHQHESSLALLRGRGLAFPLVYDTFNTVHHGHATIAILVERYHQEGLALTREHRVWEGLAALIGFHHGKLAHSDVWRRKAVAAIGTKSWRTEQFALMDNVIAAWGAPSPTLTSSGRQWPTWLLGVAGWCTLADWLGSMEQWFPEVDHGDDIAGYVQESFNGAEQALGAAGMTYTSALVARAFGDMFTDQHGNPATPRPLQAQAIALPLRTESGPTLTIMEAPTGEGKTEAAFYLSARQQEATDGAGLYVAMPSQATSNGLFSRLQSFLKRSHHTDAGPINLLLIHGASALHPDQEQLVEEFINARKGFSEVYSNDNDTGSIEPRVETAEWFLPKKRSLLAPYGIGTVDQALLGVLYSKHFFLRLFGLRGKTVIFDEIHAYDTYMNELFCRLLEWLRVGGTNVILLSATLPAVTRQRLIAAWTGSAGTEPNTVTPSYPAIWHVGAKSSEIVEPISFPASQSQRAEIEFHTPDIGTVAATVIATVAEGATVVVIVNTVQRAQDLFAAIEEGLKKLPALQSTERVLFHARFPFSLRQRIEAHVNQRFGKGRPSLTPAILVATQVAEQSLDLDADYMLSDLAPIDLLLQRAGRLHRHGHHIRPENYGSPKLAVLCPEEKVDERGKVEELPVFKVISGNGHIYDHATLNRTWWLLRQRSGWTLSEDYRELIESVYSPNAGSAPESLGERARTCWSKDENARTESHDKEQSEAHQRLIVKPEHLHHIITQYNPQLVDEDEGEVHQAYQALTRLGGPTIEMVCLHEDESGRLWLDEHHRVPMPILPCSRDDIRALMECTVKLSGYRVLALLTSLADTRWNKLARETPGIARLRPLIFRDRHWRDGHGIHIEYNTRLGILYHQSED